LAHLENTLVPDAVEPRGPHHAGAGLGLRYMIENSAGLYFFVEKDKRTLVACSLLLEGLKANFNIQKHFHLSFK
jgi:hypothetical protein